MSNYKDFTGTRWFDKFFDSPVTGMTSTCDNATFSMDDTNTLSYKYNNTGGKLRAKMGTDNVFVRGDYRDSSVAFNINKTSGVGVGLSHMDASGTFGASVSGTIYKPEDSPVETNSLNLTTTYRPFHSKDLSVSFGCKMDSGSLSNNSVTVAHKPSFASANDETPLWHTAWNNLGFMASGTHTNGYNGNVTAAVIGKPLPFVVTGVACDIAIKKGSPTFTSVKATVETEVSNSDSVRLQFSRPTTHVSVSHVFNDSFRGSVSASVNNTNRHLSKVGVNMSFSS
jgi:hypothetical protein